MADPEVLTDTEIEARLAGRPDLLERFKAGDLSVLAEIVSTGTGAKVKSTTIRSLA